MEVTSIPIVVDISIEAQRIGVTFPYVPFWLVSVKTPRNVKAHADAAIRDGLAIFDDGLAGIRWQRLVGVGRSRR